MKQFRRVLHAASLIPTMVMGWDKWSRVATNLYVSKVPFNKEEKSLTTFSEEKQEKYQDQAVGLVVSATEKFEIDEPILPLIFGNRYDPIRSSEWEEKNIRHLLLNIKDFTSAVNLSKTINDVITIQAYRELKKAVLVHCKAGRSRSPMIVSATLGTFDLPKLENCPSYFFRLDENSYANKKEVVDKIIAKNTIAENAYLYIFNAKNNALTCLYREAGKIRPIENHLKSKDEKKKSVNTIVEELKIEENKPICELSSIQTENLILNTTASRVGSSKELVETAIGIISFNRPHINLSEGNINSAIQIVEETRKYLQLHPHAVSECVKKEKKWLSDQAKKIQIMMQKREEYALLKKQIMQLQSYENLLNYKKKLLDNEPWMKAMLSGPPERVKHIINLFESMEQSKDDKWQEDLIKLTGPANDLLSATPFWMGGETDQAEREKLIHDFKNEVEKLVLAKSSQSEDKPEHLATRQMS